jgi:hypothetical protein
MHRERAREARMAKWWIWDDDLDFIRRCRHTVHHARRLATILGPEHPRIWAALERAADMERIACAIEAEVDDMIASGYLT